jgi:crooked neck
LILDWDLVFPDDEKERNPGTFKLLQLAHAWKAKQQEQQSNNDNAPANAVQLPPEIKIDCPPEDGAPHITPSIVS